MPFDKEFYRRRMPGVVALLEHPYLAKNEAFVTAVQALADRDVMEKLTHDQLSLFFGIHLGVIRDLLHQLEDCQAASMQIVREKTH